MITKVSQKAEWLAYSRFIQKSNEQIIFSIGFVHCWLEATHAYEVFPCFVNLSKNLQNENKPGNKQATNKVNDNISIQRNNKETLKTNFNIEVSNVESFGHINDKTAMTKLICDITGRFPINDTFQNYGATTCFRINFNVNIFRRLSIHVRHINLHVYKNLQLKIYLHAR